MTRDQIGMIAPGVGISVLSAAIGLLLLYLIIRLAITHGMLSYSRHLEEERRHEAYVSRR